MGLTILAASLSDTHFAQHIQFIRQRVLPEPLDPQPKPGHTQAAADDKAAKYIANSLLYPKIKLDFSYLLTQPRQLVLNDVPHNLIRNKIIPMRQDISKPDNPLVIIYPNDYVRVNFLEPIERFPTISNCRSTADRNKASAL